MRRLDNLQVIQDSTVSIEGSSGLLQSFVAQHHNLNSLRFVVFNPVLGGGRAYTAKILDTQKQTLREMTFTQGNFGWQHGVRFDFAPIADSQGKLFYFALQSVTKDASAAAQLSNLDTDAQKEFAEKNFTKVGIARNNSYTPGQLWVNDQETTDDLTFETYYTGSGSSLVQDVLIDFAKRITLDPGFSLIYVVSLLLITTLLIILWKKICR
ncbi:hypothetical protein C4579_00500 [Candidatus Microgenomates bacterium]|nr:MAG: hypothetical protein C4579_00500 [Candidatus Microgenomates bacterium]